MMRMIILFLASLIAPCVMAASDQDIVAAVKHRAEKEFFPKDVKVESVSDVRFFPTNEDSPYARFGNACGKVFVSKGDKSSSLIFIAPVVEKSSQLHIDAPTLYDLDRQEEVARSDLLVRCK